MASIGLSPALQLSLPARQTLIILGIWCTALLHLSGMAVAQSSLPYLSGGPNSTFAQFDFSQLFLDEEIHDAIHSSVDANELTSSCSISIRDLGAPRKAVDQYNYAASYLRSQNAKEAIKCLRKAIDIYPEFVSAHNMLGLAYLDEQDARAKEEFEAAAKLDDRFPVSFLNLGMMALNQNDFASADANLEKAAFLSQRDPRILISLAFAENGDHKYAETLRTAARVHALNHRGLGNVHYIAASAAMSLHDFATAQQELRTLLKEEPANPLGPIAQKQLELLGRHDRPAPQTGSLHAILQPDASAYRVQTFPDNEHLHAELAAMKNLSAVDDCGSCGDARAFAAIATGPVAYGPVVESWHNLFTIHRAVDETAVFFSVSRNGHPVNDLGLGDIEIRDNNHVPDRILEFVPQSKLPLRLGVLIDTSDSTERRFLFEKRAAEH
ncbi:MAG TPA: tetratricopeptide repeat protein, partial [Candidatus Binatia bacterium]|nr:tetratricopeptide repeat protein [Candidatus Binatia bacterium]